MKKNKLRNKNGYHSPGLAQTLEGDSNGGGDVLVTGLHVHSEKDIFFHIRKPRSVHWSIAWSDLMMTMFVLFLVMYIYQTQNMDFLLTNGGRPTDTEDRIQRAIEKDTTKADNSDKITDISFDDLYEFSADTFRAETVEEMIKMDLVSDKAIRIILPSDLLFDTGKAELKAVAVKSLGRLADVLKNTPYMINIVGHTDNVPIHTETFATNWELSTTRACKVARFLIQEKGLPENRFYVTGHAHNQPLVANTTLRNKAANRRVEIIVTKELPHNKLGDNSEFF